MLAKGTIFTYFVYTFSDNTWDFLKAVDFKHAAKSLYKKVPRSERSRVVHLCAHGVPDCPDYKGPVSGLRSFF